MKNIITAGIKCLLVVSVIGCGASSSEEQRRALTHQNNSDEAARQGQFGIAGDEQREAADAHHEAVKKAIEEGKPIPPQTKPGDRLPPPTP